MLMAVNEPYALMVQPDDILISPREVDEHFGTMVCFHPRYALGDHHNYMDKDDFLREMYLDTVGHDEAGMKRYERMVNIVSSRFRHGPKTEERAIDEAMQKVISEKYLMLPLYLYDHSGLAMSTESFSGRAPHAECDSGQVGWIYVSKEYVVQSAICDKKVEIERAKLVEQAKNIAKPREKKSCLSEIQLYNSMVLGIQNYYQLATCISIDCRELHRRVMTVLTNRLNTETGSMLKHEGGTITQAEKERFGQSKMIRYVSGIDQMIYPIAFIKNKIPMAKRSIVCSYTKEGRAPIHTELNLNQYVLKGLREKISVGHSTEYHDSKISLFSAQKGKCAISGEEFADAEHVAVWLKVPRALGGFERYKNMVLIHKKYLILLQELPQAVIKDLIKTLNITKKMLVKINSLREQANLSAII